MRRIRSRVPDPRPDWRDPNMPALFSCTDPMTGKQFLKEFSADRARYAFARKLARGDHLLPSWRDDPTYNLRKDTK